MKRRVWKTVALFATGGVVLQIGGCAGGGLGAVLIQNFLGLIISAILSGILGNNTPPA